MLVAVIVAAGVALYPQVQKAGGIRMPAAAGETPSVAQLTSSPEEQDYPAIAQSGDNVYVSYVEFVHSDRRWNRKDQIRRQAPKNFDFLARPAGGDQVFLLTYSKSQPYLERARCRLRAQAGRHARRRSRWMARSACGSSGPPTRTATSISTRSRWPAGRGPPKCASPATRAPT